MGLNLPLQGKKESLMPPTENIFIPALPETEAEKEAYEDLYPYITHAKNCADDK